MALIMLSNRLFWFFVPHINLQHELYFSPQPCNFDMIKKEINYGRDAGPFYQIPFTPFVVMPISVPKQHGNFKLIHHLSYNHSDSVHPGISDSAVHYSTIIKLFQL